MGLEAASCPLCYHPLARRHLSSGHVHLMERVNRRTQGTNASHAIGAIAVMNASNRTPLTLHVIQATTIKHATKATLVISATGKTLRSALPREKMSMAKPIVGSASTVARSPDCATTASASLRASLSIARMVSGKKSRLWRVKWRSWSSNYGRLEPRSRLKMRENMVGSLKA